MLSLVWRISLLRRERPFALSLSERQSLGSLVAT